MFLKLTDNDSKSPIIVKVATIEKVFTNEQNVTCILTSAGFHEVEELVNDIWNEIQRQEFNEEMKRLGLSGGAPPSESKE